jgi:hypothetical protein
VQGILLFRLSDEVDLRLKSTVTRGKKFNDILIPTYNVREVISFPIVVINTQAATTMRRQATGDRTLKQAVVEGWEARSSYPHTLDAVTRIRSPRAILWR